MRGLVLVAVVLALSAAAASASTPQCWHKVLSDWSKDGRLDGTYKCDCLREAVKHVPTDLEAYTSLVDFLHDAERRACRTIAPASVPVAADEKGSRNWPAIALTTVLGLVAGSLLLWRRRQRRVR